MVFKNKIQITLNRNKTHRLITKSKMEIVINLPPKSKPFKRQVIIKHVETDDNMIIKTIVA